MAVAGLTATDADPPVPVRQSAGVITVVANPNIVTCLVVVDGALSGPDTVSVIVYVPGEEKICVGLATVAVFDVPDATSAKSQLNPVGQEVDVFVNATVLELVQV